MSNAVEEHYVPQFFLATVHYLTCTVLVYCTCVLFLVQSIHLYAKPLIYGVYVWYCIGHCRCKVRFDAVLAAIAACIATSHSVNSAACPSQVHELQMQTYTYYTFA